jgi:hypothetical protein
MRKLLYIIILGVSLSTLAFPQYAFALNQTGDWSFTDNTNWRWDNATSTDTCGNTTQTTVGTSFSTFARNSTAVVSSRSNNAAKSVSVVQRGNTFQTFVATSSGSVNFKGRFDYSASIGGAGAYSSVAWARLDIYSSNNSTYVGTVGCASFSAATATTTVTSSQPIVLTGGTTYVIRLSTSLKSVNTTGTSNNIYMDNIIVTAPPVNVGVSLNGSNQPVLTWNTSTATTSANGILATNGYNIYRGTSSLAETALASSTATSYTDTAVSQSTTYYYWITNDDTALVESATSTEVSISVPGPPTVSTSAANTDTISATLNGSISATGGSNSTVRGFAWGTSTSLQDVGVFATTTESGSFGISSFTKNVSGLISGTIYYFRAYATNPTGTGYGSILNFTAGSDTTRTRIIRLFEGFRVTLFDGRIILR